MSYIKLFKVFRINASKRNVFFLSKRFLFSVKTDFTAMENRIAIFETKTLPKVVKGYNMYLRRDAVKVYSSFHIKFEKHNKKQIAKS